MSNSLPTPWTITYQVPFVPRIQTRILEGLPCSPPGDIPNTGIEPASLCLLHWQAWFCTTSSSLGDPQCMYMRSICICVSFWYNFWKPYRLLSLLLQENKKPKKGQLPEMWDCEKRLFLTWHFILYSIYQSSWEYRCLCFTFHIRQKARLWSS